MTKKRLIYRGFEIEQRDDGKWVVKGKDGEIISDPLDMEEAAYSFVDKCKRMGMK